MVRSRTFRGASHDTVTEATMPDGNCRLMKATSGRSPSTDRADVCTEIGASPSRWNMIEKSCGARSQITLASLRTRPRFSRDDVR
jgi:hypothetical protein